jgi:hypothetical protein
MNNQTPIPATTNDAWGFYGCLRDRAETAWPLAMESIANATGEPLESVRAFLDSKHGRHFGDEVHNGLAQGLNLPAAINAATQQWMTWTIGRQISQHYDIPKGLPYLTGFVISTAILDEVA